MLSIINPEHASFREATAHWVFDGRQKDAAEFSQALLLTQDADILGRWESRSQLGEGSIRECRSCSHTSDTYNRMESSGHDNDVALASVYTSFLYGI